MGFKMPLAKETVTRIVFGWRLHLCIRLRTSKDCCRRKCLQAWPSSDGIHDGIVSLRCVCGPVGFVFQSLQYFGSACTEQSDGANKHDTNIIQRDALSSKVSGLSCPRED